MRCRTLLVALAAMLGYVTACTSDAPAGVRGAHGTSGEMSSSAALTRSATSATPPPSATPTCAAKSRPLTFHRRAVLTHAVPVGLAPHTARHNTLLPTVRVVRARVIGAHAGADLLTAVGHHLAALVAAVGEHTDRDPVVSRLLMRNSSGRRVTYVAYRGVEVYRGRFVSTCAATRTRGGYVTFGPEQPGVYECGRLPATELELRARRFCG